MSDRLVKLGIIGTGIMGQRMLDAVASGPPGPVGIAGIWDPAPAARAEMARRFPDIPVFGDADAVVAASDCVYVASPPSSHLSYGRAALRAGKCFFGEKPLAVDLAEARGFVREAGARGAINFPFASSLAVAQLGRWIDEGQVGAPMRVGIEVAFRTWPRPWQADAAAWLDGRQEGGFTREVVSHFLFLCRRLLGPLSDVKAEVAYPEGGASERRIAATFLAGSVPVTLAGVVGDTDKDDHNTWTLEGDAGAIRLRDWAIAERRIGERFEPAPDAIAHEQARPMALRRQLEGVAKLTRGEPHHLATLQEALDVQEVVETILAS